MGQWIAPRYAEVVAAWQQDDETDAPLLALGPDAAPGPAGRGFVLERLCD